MGILDTTVTMTPALQSDRDDQKNEIHLQAGAGIVADSIPEMEYEETLNKAKGMLKAIRMAENIS